MQALGYASPMLRLLDLRGRAPGAPLALPRPDLAGEAPLAEVRAILGEVRARGDAALFEFTKRFDGAALTSLRIPDAALDEALERTKPALRDALGEARDAIVAFHRHRSAPPPPFERGGVTVTHLELPVARAGIYAPGGRAKYPSSVLMAAVPARVAGVDEVVLCVPPGPDGTLPDEILAAARLAGVDEVYSVGGAQAIGAMAYGTESIRRVDVIVGPGSRWVSLAQREVRGAVGVPAAFAGPSEVVVVADDSTPPELAAIDLVVQAEHGPDGLAWLVTWSKHTADAVRAEVERLVAASPRRDETLSTLGSGGYAVLVDDASQALEVANEIAPEHLELMSANAHELVAGVRNVGAVFVGVRAPASIGDYAAGPSHVLPTFRSARFSSVLGVEDFVRRVHAIEVSEAGLARVAPIVAALADCEGLSAHGESVRMRTGAPTWSRPGSAP